MPLYTDQLYRVINIPAPPKRIISVVPSQTELLHFLGLGEKVTAITKFCVHPTGWFQTKTRIGGTKQLNLSKIRQLHPDLILANKEENKKEQIDELSDHFPVWISDVNDLKTAYQMISAVGKLTETEKKAEELVTTIQRAFATDSKSNSNLKPRTAYLIWKDPYMTVGGDTFIHQMLNHAGFENIFSGRKRYPQIEIEEINKLGCEVLLLSSEPYPFSKNHIYELTGIHPNTKIILADGELFSWYGSRLLKAPAYFKSLYQQATA